MELGNKFFPVISGRIVSSEFSSNFRFHLEFGVNFLSSGNSSRLELETAEGEGDVNMPWCGIGNATIKSGFLTAEH